MSDGKRSRRELHAFKVKCKRSCNGSGEHGLAEAGHVLDKQMAPGKEGNACQVDYLSFANNDLFNVFGKNSKIVSNSIHVISPFLLKEYFF